MYAVIPGGIFAVVADLSFYFDLPEMDEEELANSLKKKASVALAPGSPNLFGPNPACHVCLSVATSVEVLNVALHWFKEGLKFLHVMHCDEEEKKV